jgi:hypothetical protein
MTFEIVSELTEADLQKLGLSLGFDSFALAVLQF